MSTKQPAPATQQPAPAGVTGWQDMSTAPKDGTRFVARGHNYGIYSETQHVCIAQWFRGCWMEVSDWNETSELKYLTEWAPLPQLSDYTPQPAPATQPAPQQDAQEPVAWRELCRRLYVELFHCDKQMTSGNRPKWQQGKTVRDVLADAKAALDAAPQPSPAAQGDALDAARYAILRRGQHWSVIDGLGDPLTGDRLDAAVDAVCAAQEGN